MKRAANEPDSDPKLSGLDSAIAWLADRDTSVSLVADHFGTNRTHVRQLIYRGRHGRLKEKLPRWLVAPLQTPNDPFNAPNQKLRRQLGLREGHDAVGLYRSGRIRLNDLEEDIDQLGTGFWTGVRYGAGIETLRFMRQRIGFVAHLPRLRIRARLEHLISETYLHGGKSLSALHLALFAVHLWRAAWAESEDPTDLKEMARTTLLISQAHLVRLEPERAKDYLDLYEQACKRAHAPLGAEYFRQRAVVSFQREDWEHAREPFLLASRVLETTEEYGRGKPKFEVLSIGERQISLLPPVDWDRSQEILEYMEENVPADDIHRSMALNWTVACGFASGSPQAQLKAQELLEAQSGLAVGFGHQATIARLLKITPKLPQRTRAHWVRHALYENAFRNL